ncbi:hypothetical protein NUW58_g9115 [Xylaria curta]|uniref:Uncharacterized protein n=1 Tax=Xylaria curta TaxID=42375 RepID=A0ACC1N2S4_9PEZI|nr:hypothetical protein NUW58_g9115 [Xylaria curta]
MERGDPARPAKPEAVPLRVVHPEPHRGDEAGADTKAAVLDTIRRELRECTALLRESPAYGGTEAAPEWLDDTTAPDCVDTMALFGFDFSALDSTFTMDLPVWTDTPSTGEVQDFI